MVDDRDGLQPLRIEREAISLQESEDFCLGLTHGDGKKTRDDVTGTCRANCATHGGRSRGVAESSGFMGV
jgi:hypothetical protein